MAAPNKTTDQNILPVQALFNLDNSFNTFIGQGQPFYATINPIQSGLTITNSTIDSSVIGGFVPAAATFTSMATTSGTVANTAANPTDLTNKAYVDMVVQGYQIKAEAQCATTGNITLSGLQTIDGYTTLAGDRILVKNQTNQANNGVYVAASGAWARSSDCNTYASLVSAFIFIQNGSTQQNSGWVCTIPASGTLGTTPITWSQLASAASYFAGTGLTLSSYTFSITNTGVSANSYGSASSVGTFTVNAQGQLTSAGSTAISIAPSQINAAIPNSSLANSSVTFNGVSVALGGSGTITSNTTQTLTIGAGLSGGSFNGSSAVTIANTGVLSFSAGTTGFTPNTATNGAITLGGTLNVANGGTGATTLTGYVYGNGTGAFTASTTIPNTSITGLGTMSTQNSSSVAITGGTINNASIGVTTQAAGYFTTLAANAVTSTTPALSYNASNSIATFGSTTSNSYNQLVIQNKSASSGASTNYVISNDQGTDSTYYGEYGMNSSIYSSGTPIDFFSINNGIYFSGHDGDITVGSGNGYKHYFAWGTSGQSAHVINAVGALGFSTNLGTTPATTGTTGYGTSGQALVTAGSTAAPAWGFVGLNGGGTNAALTAVAGGIVYSGASALAISATGTSGQVLTSNGTSAPTWTTPTAYATVTDDTTTNATRYPLFASATSGNLTTEYTSSTKYQFNPYTGTLTATVFSGSGASLTSIPNSALNNSSITVGSTAISLGGTATTIAGLTSVTSTTFVGALTGNASSATTATTATNATNTAITDNTTSNATWYPTIVSSTSGNLPQTTSSTKLQFNPSTGALTVNNIIYIAP